ncbi:mitochondrial amidoxime reducing component 2-like [Dermatophagoides pteronyssinus]|uniref:mitochondrial amidoxime reducing component 2-like n=1 Tax=Dermatophagoides pteronyssinus TaxID=6956 RepID=UPI003F6674B8
MNDLQTKIGLALTILSGLIILKSWIKRSRQGPPKIKKLIIYPIKSLQGFEVDHLDIVSTGVEWMNFHDRSMVLVNQKNIMLTQRNKPKLALIKLKLQDKNIVLDAPEMETLEIPYFDDNLITNDIVSLEIWGQQTEGYVCRKEFSDWFSRYLDSETKLLRIGPELQHRQSQVFDNLLDNHVVYQDGFPIMLINDCSIDDLNHRLNGNLLVDYRNFRPNILVENADPYDEDNWKNIRINSLEFSMPKPCDRCVMTTVDPEKGIQHPDKEPLKTLKSYRIDKKWDEKAPLFGINLIPKSNGKIFINDQLEII